jgi:hypothetical protein
MAANWDLGQQFLGGASLAARIAGQIGQQGIAKESLENQKSTGAAELVARTGYSPDQLNDPDSGAGASIRGRMGAAADAENRLHGAQADYFGGRNSTYAAAAQARAGALAAKTAQGGLSALQASLKDYDQMSMIDPDGSKGIYTPQKALEHAAMLNTYNLKQGISMPAPTPGGATPPSKTSLPAMSMTSPVSDMAGGLATRAASGLMGFFGGGAPASAGAAPAPAPAAPSINPGRMIRVRSKATGATGMMNANDPNIGAYETL